MDELPPALPHGKVEEVFSDVFFVTGTMRTELIGAHWHFSRNMTVVRDRGSLTLINSVRLDDAGLAQLDALGHVTNVVKIGSLHGRDDAFYKARYGATFWALPGMQPEHGLTADKELSPDGEMPFSGCSVFAFHTTKLPECILRIDREGGILVACDPVAELARAGRILLRRVARDDDQDGLFQPSNLGPLWMQVTEPRGQTLSACASGRSGMRSAGTARHFATRQGSLHG